MERASVVRCGGGLAGEWGSCPKRAALMSRAAHYVCALLSLAVLVAGACSPALAASVEWQQFDDGGEPLGESVEWLQDAPKSFARGTFWRSTKPIASAVLFFQRGEGSGPWKATGVLLPEKAASPWLSFEASYDDRPSGAVWIIAVTDQAGSVAGPVEVPDEPNGGVTVKLGDDGGVLRVSTLKETGISQPAPEGCRYLKLMGQYVTVELRKPAVGHVSPRTPRPGETVEPLRPVPGDPTRPFLIGAFALVGLLVLVLLWSWLAPKIDGWLFRRRMRAAERRRNALAGQASAPLGTVAPGSTWALPLKGDDPPSGDRRAVEDAGRAEARRQKDQFDAVLATIKSDLNHIWEGQKAADERSGGIRDEVTRLSREVGTIQSALSGLRTAVDSLQKLVTDRLPTVEGLSDLPSLAIFQRETKEEARSQWLSQTLAGLQEVARAERAAGHEARAGRLEAVVTEWRAWLQQFDDAWRRYERQRFAKDAFAGDTSLDRCCFCEEPGPPEATRVVAEFRHSPVHCRYVEDGLTNLSVAMSQRQQQRPARLNTVAGVGPIIVAPGTPVDNALAEAAEVMAKERPNRSDQGLTRISHEFARDKEEIASGVANREAVVKRRSRRGVGDEQVAAQDSSADRGSATRRAL